MSCCAGCVRGVGCTDEDIRLSTIQSLVCRLAVRGADDHPILGPLKRSVDEGEGMMKEIDRVIDAIRTGQLECAPLAKMLTNSTRDGKGRLVVDATQEVGNDVLPFLFEMFGEGDEEVKQ